MPANFAERRGFEKGGRPRTAREVLLDALAVLEQEKGAPALRVVELEPLIDWRPWGLGDVGHEIVRSLCERGARLRADFVRRGIERIEPRKRLAVEKLDRRQPREEHECRLRREHAAPADEHIEAGVEALEPRTCMARARLIQPRPQERLERRVVVPQDLVCVLDRRVHGRWMLDAGRNTGEKSVVHVRGLLALSLPLEEPRLVQQRGEETRIGSERPLERVALCALVFQLAMRKGKVDPEDRASRVERCGPFEQRPGCSGVAAEQRAHAGDIEHARVIRRGGPRLRERALGFAAIALPIGVIDCIDEHADLRLGGGGCTHSSFVVPRIGGSIVRYAVSIPGNGTGPERRAVGAV